MRKFQLITSLLTVFCILSAVNLFAGGEKESVQKKTEEKMELVILCHKVHQNAVEGSEKGGKNLVAEFQKMYPNVTAVKYITAGTPEVRDKLFREAALPKTDIDISLVYTPWISNTMPDLFAPLDDVMKKYPVEDIDDIFKNLRDELVIDGKTYGMPMRAGGNGLFFNAGILKERGISPKFDVIEDVIDAVYKCTFTRPNGDEVYGYAKQGVKEEAPFTLGNFFRTKDADYLGENLKPQFTDPRIVWSLELHRQMFQKKALAQNFSALANQDVIDLIKNKRVAFTSYGPDYASRFVGDDGLSWDEVGFAVIPAAKDYKSKYPTGSPAITFQWAFVVPKNAKNRDMSWNFIRFVSTKDGILNQALSGNNPVRKSTYDLAEYKSKVHFVEVTRNIFNSGRKLFPGFESFSEVRDILGEEIQRAVLGEKTAAQALADAQKTTGPLIK